MRKDGGVLVQTYQPWGMDGVLTVEGVRNKVLLSNTTVQALWRSKCGSFHLMNGLVCMKGLKLIKWVL
jgi:hypothetical protein